MPKLIKFNVVKRFKLFVAISIVLCSVGFVGLIALPFGVSLFNFDIDFLGGTSMQYALHKQFDVSMQNDINSIVKSVIGEDASSIQKTGDGTEVLIKTKSLSTDQRNQVSAKLTEKYKLSASDRLMVDNVSPAVGKDLRNAAALATTIAVILMLLYITIRFEFKSGMSAIICLAHDILVMVSALIIFHVPVNMTFIAAVLTILGYSINSVIIVFDRIRENRRLAGKKDTFGEVVEKSIWQTMVRNINTTLTVVFAITMIYILGVQSLKNFMLPLLIGVISGAYSSIFLSGPIWLKLRGNKN